jgi:hypothetical protein
MGVAWGMSMDWSSAQMDVPAHRWIAREGTGTPLADTVQQEAAHQWIARESTGTPLADTMQREVAHAPEGALQVWRDDEMEAYLTPVQCTIYMIRRKHTS